MDLVGLFAVLGLFLIIILVPTLEYEMRLRRRVKEDYLKARGTFHRRILRDCLPNLDQKISEGEAKVQNLLSRRVTLEDERKRELEVMLTTQIVNKELDQIPGIGPVLKDRIIRHCFDGSLGSLSDSRFVHGIGEQKHAIIREWVKNTEPRIPQLLLEDFPGKADILKKYAELDGGVERELKINELELRSLKQLRSEATAALSSLGPVDASTFLAAYKGNGKAAEMVTRYLFGVFPEWGRVPSWFKTLMETCKKV